MSLPPSTANWHWKNKNVTAWGKSWFERELPTITVKGDGDEVVSISQVTDVDGDIELGQRKSKLITIYECKIDLNWTGTASDGTEVSGSLHIPEVSHETTLDGTADYVYQWTLSTASSPAVDALFELAKSRLPTALETKFAELPIAIIDIHGKDLQVSAAPSTDTSRVGSPAPTAAPKAGASSANGPKAVKREVKPVNTSTVTVDATFQVAADELYALLTDEASIPKWTRAPARSKPEPEGEFSLFGGGVKGTYAALERPTKIVQNWRLSSPTWPESHTGTLTLTLDQSTDSTKLTLNLAGVPTGLEDEIKRNLEGYYIHGLKSIGYVQLFPSPPPARAHTAPSPPTRRLQPQRSGAPSDVGPDGYARIAAIVLAVLALAAAFAVPLLSQRPTPPPKA